MSMIYVKEVTLRLASDLLSPLSLPKVLEIEALLQTLSTPDLQADIE